MFTISYGSYVFSDTGIPQYGRNTQSEAGSLPVKRTETIHVKQRFDEESFADNQARLATLRAALLATPRGTLLIKDERGTVLINADVKFADISEPAEWGQYKIEVTVTFEMFINLASNGQAPATFTPTGTDSAVSLPNVNAWSGGVKVNRYNDLFSNRRECIETLSASGRITVSDTTLTYAERRDFLLAAKASIEAIADCADGTLAWGGFSQANARIDDVKCDIGDGQEEAVWTLQASWVVYPDGNYAECDYEISFSDVNESNERTLTVAGKINAATLALAQAAAAAIKATYTSGRIFESQDFKNREVDGGDGEQSMECTFSYKFKEAFGAITEWRLKIATKADTKSADVTVTYSGSVTATDATTALAQAATLGGSGSGLLMESSTDVESLATAALSIFTKVTFSYTWRGKSAIQYAEVQGDTDCNRFGLSSVTVSGFVVCDTQANAATMAATFKISGVIIRSEKTTYSNATRVSTVQFIRADFHYSYAQAASGSSGSIDYAIEQSNDIEQAESAVTLSGTAYGSTPDLAAAMIAAVLSTPSGGHLLRNRISDGYESQSDITLLKEIAFSYVWSVPFVAPDGVGILEANYAVKTSFGLWKTQIDEVPGGSPVVQENVTQSCGRITVSGSVTAVDLGTAQTWARDKATLLSGYTESADESPEYVFQKMSGTTVNKVRFPFSYCAMDPAIQWPVS